MVKRKEEIGNRCEACTYARRIYIAFVFAITGVFLRLLYAELAKGGDPTLEIGLCVAVFVSLIFGVIGILEGFGQQLPDRVSFERK